MITAAMLELTELENLKQLPTEQLVVIIVQQQQLIEQLT